MAKHAISLTEITTFVVDARSKEEALRILNEAWSNGQLHSTPNILVGDTEVDFTHEE